MCQITGNQKNDTIALYIADAGVEHVIYLLRTDQSIPAQLNIQFMLGRYQVTYDSSSGIITSQGILQDGYTKTIEAQVTVSGGSSPYNITVDSWKEI